MFRDLHSAWTDIEAGMLEIHGDARAKSILQFGKELFFLGAYTSQTMMDCIAKFTEDPDEALAQLAELRAECQKVLGGEAIVVHHLDEVDPKDQYKDL